MRERVLDYLWESSEAAARASRAALAPLGAAFAAAVALRNLAYDRGWLRSRPLALPTIAVGNLTVGGTGKTPIAAWIASQLRARGTCPAIILRGYGGDETLVHRRLNPGLTVIADADRVRGVARARAAGANVAVLDDGFQHRRARRDADFVLLSADRFGSTRLLPAGPWREPLSSLERAHAVVVTRKSVSLERACEVLARALRFAPRAFGAVVELAPGPLVNAVTGESRPSSAISGLEVLAVSAIGDARAFESQLGALGARVLSAPRADHHRFSAAAVATLAGDVPRGTWALCTLKDAVKLAAYWPREASPLWYLSQRVSVEMGSEALDGFLAGFVACTALQDIEMPAPASPTIEPNAP